MINIAQLLTCIFVIIVCIICIRNENQRNKQMNVIFKRIKERKLFMNKWIGVKDRLPDRLQCVIGLFKDGCMYVVSQCDWVDVCDDWHYMPQPIESHSIQFDQLTHWIPLPQPPENK